MIDKESIIPVNLQLELEARERKRRANAARAQIGKGKKKMSEKQTHFAAQVESHKVREIARKSYNDVYPPANPFDLDNE